MLRKNKKIGAVMAALALAVSLPITASAASSKVKTDDYGTLRGTLNNKGYFTTSVTQNDDNAYLTISGTVQNKAGATLYKQTTIKSSRGRLSFDGYYKSIPSGAHSIYGAHGVQGGSSHGAAAVYTYTTV